MLIFQGAVHWLVWVWELSSSRVWLQNPILNVTKAGSAFTRGRSNRARSRKTWHQPFLDEKSEGSATWLEQDADKIWWDVQGGVELLRGWDVEFWRKIPSDKMGSFVEAAVSLELMVLGRVRFLLPIWGATKWRQKPASCLCKSKQDTRRHGAWNGGRKLQHMWTIWLHS